MASNESEALSSVLSPSAPRSDPSGADPPQAGCSASWAGPGMRWWTTRRQKLLLRKHARGTPSGWRCAPAPRHPTGDANGAVAGSGLRQYCCCRTFAVVQMV